LSEPTMNFLIERCQTCSILVLGRCICALPCPTPYGWNLVVTSAN